MPWDYDRLPLDVINWLLPVRAALTAIEEEAHADAQRKAESRWR